MKILIIEDEKPAVQKLLRLLPETGFDIEVLGCLTSAEQSINWLTKNPAPDLIFMDIQLEDGLCFEIFETIPVKTPVIFITAFDSYALKAFRVNSVDYLLKPLDPAELKRALEKFQQVHKDNIKGLGNLINALQPPVKERFLIKIGEHYKSLQITDIQCFFIRERCCFISQLNGKEYPIEFSLDKVERMIDPRRFFRVNREFVINFYAIRDIIAYSAGRLKVKLTEWPDKDEIIVSRERVNDFKKWMDR